jgi:hypothetical protein
MLKPSCLAAGNLSKTRDDTPTCCASSGPDNAGQKILRNHLAEGLATRCLGVPDAVVQGVDTKEGKMVSLDKVSESRASQGTKGQVFGLCPRAHPVKCKCCRKGAVASTNDDNVPLGEFAHVWRHGTLQRLMFSPSVVGCLSSLVAQSCVAGEKTILLRGAGAAVPSSSLSLRPHARIRSEYIYILVISR